METTESVAGVWAAFLAARPDLADATTTYSAWHFCDNQADADELAELVVTGKKRATASLLCSWELEGEPIPRIGDLSVVTDWAGRARCVIRTTHVDIVPFDEVPPEFAALEGEGDGSLDFWRAAHRAAFGRELSEVGRVLEADADVVCQHFEVVFVAGGDVGAATSGAPSDGTGLAPGGVDVV